MLLFGALHLTENLTDQNDGNTITTPMAEVLLVDVLPTTTVLSIGSMDRATDYCDAGVLLALLARSLTHGASLTLGNIVASTNCLLARRMSSER